MDGLVPAIHVFLSRFPGDATASSDLRPLEVDPTPAGVYPSPMPRFYFDDLTLGRAFPLPPHAVTREEIIAFAREFDPQPFHLGDGGNGLSDGLTASGWHTCAIFMRALCDGLLLDSACLGSPGIDFLRWLRPVRPGDTLAASATVIETRLSKSRPDRGIVRFRHDVVNQGSEPVLVMENPILFLARPAP